MTSSGALLKKFHEGKFSFGMFGVGYVGRPLALVFAKKGRRPLGFDIVAKYVALLHENGKCETKK